MQISLAARHDYNDFSVPVSNAIGSFTRITNAGTETSLVVFGVVPTFIAGELTETQGWFIAENCYANGVINQFQWP